MANEIQTIFPVYLPRAKDEGSTEDYDNAVSQNENLLNQNFAILNDALIEALERLKKLEDA